MKRSSTSFIGYQEMQMKTTMKYQYTSIIRAKIKNSDNAGKNEKKRSFIHC